MSDIMQNGEFILQEYIMENLGVDFKVILVNSVRKILQSGEVSIEIPNEQGLLKKIAIARAVDPLKLKGGDVKFLRKTLGLRSKDLAEKLDVSPEHLSRCESGEKILSSNSEKVLRTLVLMESILVLRKLIEENNDNKGKVRLIEKMNELIDSCSAVVSAMKIVSVRDSDADLTFRFALEKASQCPRPANDRHTEPEWFAQAA